MTPPARATPGRGPVGFALAGGRSLRMGVDKALLPWGATDLLGHALERLGAVCDDVRILCGAEPLYLGRGRPVEVDLVRDAGPLGGLLTALVRADGRPVLLLGVDLPLVPPALLVRLVALGAGVDAVVPLSARGPEPLCALYGPACLEPARLRLAQGNARMTAFWPDVRVREVRARELADQGDPDRLYLNVNTPDDYERARRLAV